MIYEEVVKRKKKKNENRAWDISPLASHCHTVSLSSDYHSIGGPLSPFSR